MPGRGRVHPPVHVQPVLDAGRRQQTLHGEAVSLERRVGRAARRRRGSTPAPSNGARGTGPREQNHVHQLACFARLKTGEEAGRGPRSKRGKKKKRKLSRRETLAKAAAVRTAIRLVVQGTCGSCTATHLRCELSHRCCGERCSTDSRHSPCLCGANGGCLGRHRAVAATALVADAEPTTGRPASLTPCPPGGFSSNDFPKVWNSNSVLPRRRASLVRRRALRVTRVPALARSCRRLGRGWGRPSVRRPGCLHLQPRPASRVDGEQRQGRGRAPPPSARGRVAIDSRPSWRRRAHASAASPPVADAAPQARATW